MGVAGKRMMAAGAAAAILAAAGAARAADIVLDCKVQANQPDHGKTQWRRRIIVSPPTRTVRIQDDFGQGFVQRAQYPLVSINLRRIVLEEHEGKTSFVDRMSGEYVLRNAPHRFMLRGRCTGAGPMG